MGTDQALKEALGSQERVFIEDQPEYEFLRYVSKAIYTFSPGVSMPSFVRLEDVLAPAIVVRETNEWISEYKQMIETTLPETEIKIFWQNGDREVGVVMIGVNFGPNTYRFYLNYQNPQHWVWFKLIEKFPVLFICFVGDSPEQAVTHMDEVFVSKIEKLKDQFKRLSETSWDENSYAEFKDEIAKKQKALRKELNSAETNKFPI